MYSKKAMSSWFKEGFGLILLNIIERVKRSIGGFTERYSEILSQSFWWLTTIFWGTFFPALSFKTRWYVWLRYFIPFPSASVECRGCVGHAIQATTGAKMDITTFCYDDMINAPNKTLPRLYNISLCKIMVTTLHSSTSSNYKP